MTCECDKKNSYWCIECEWNKKEKNMNWLNKIYNSWKEKNNFEKGCAEELYVKLLDDRDKYVFQLYWLKKFIRIWEIAEHGQ